MVLDLGLDERSFYHNGIMLLDPDSYNNQCLILWLYCVLQVPQL